MFTKGEREDILAESYKSLEVFSKVFLPHIFTSPFCDGHREIFDALQDKKRQKIAIEAPRGFGKSSIVNLAFPMHQLVFQEIRYLVPISCSSSKAVEQSENLKNELMSNETMKALGFPALQTKDDWSKDQWLTSTGIKVLPRGAGQQIRGLNHRGARPDLLIPDDLEDPTDVKNELIRDKTKRWFFTDMLNSVDKKRDDWYVRVVGTPLHEDSLLENLFDKNQAKDWHTIRIRIADDNFEALYPEYFSTARIKTISDEYRANGILDEFYREYMCSVTMGSDGSFSSSMFRYYDEADIVKNRQVENIVIVDPAKTTTSASDYTAIVCVGVDVSTNKLYVRDVINARLHPDQIISESLAMAERYRARVLALEVTSLHEHVTYPFKNEMVRSRRFFEFVELKARAKKEDRIRMLLPFYRGGHVFHNKSCCNALEGQLLSYPRSKYWDVMDALAYVVQVLDMGLQYFQPDDLPADSAEAIAAEYRQLQEEDMEYVGNRTPRDDWRLV